MMTNSQLATASLDDIVFDGRNRHYGAYELRALYQRHMTRALIIATVACAVLLMFPVVAQMLKDTAPVAAPVVVTADPFRMEDSKPDVVVPPTPPEAQPPVQPPKQPTVKDLAPVVVKDSDAPKESDIPNRDELAGKTTGPATTEGDPNAKPGLTDVEPGLEDNATTNVVPPKPYTFVEQMPELPGGGGQLAIVAAIQKAVKYPGLALRNGVEGKVFVSFTVNPNGEVVDVAIVKGLGYGLDEETMRAIRTLPKFIPGKQNGREVSVSFTVPVTYKIQ
ncbi:energy transducer TonB [Hymenobacter arizonensis]|uniref:Protein TonB n=1 Tax=Hymenobacter arizonensis TaxID=1227077 RepID=A0A1I5WNU9_HYMAR|nr:energy transducer TonB [Hymenobacter arizonensis]SFQ21399.1 protein TonB [Hymenobacter arizonensis]